jgi:hypothetical protein
MSESRFSSNVRLHVRKIKTIKMKIFHAKYSKQAFYRFACDEDDSQKREREGANGFVGKEKR